MISISCQGRRQTDYSGHCQYELTSAQMRVWKEIMQDMQGEYVMSRLVQGDGSGKTIVAALALLTVVMNGYQGAMMAPTEVLAKQHFESLTELFDTCHYFDKNGTPSWISQAKEKRGSVCKNCIWRI